MLTSCSRITHQILSDKLDVLFPIQISHDEVQVLSIELPHFDTLSWLKSQKFSYKYYWVNRNGEEKRAAIGALEHVPSGLSLHKACDHMQDRLNVCDTVCRYYGGAAFPYGEGLSEEGARFGEYQFWLPEMELVETQNSVQLHVYMLGDRSRHYVASQLAKINWDYCDITFSKVGVSTWTMSPNYDQWEADITTVKEHIENGDVHKVVLSRKMTLTLNEQGSGFDILARLMGLNDPRYYFLIQVEDGHLFFGHSPEQLCSISGHNVSSEAIAGSIPRDQDPKRDRDLGMKLLENNKNREEHDVVKHAIQDVLTPLCTDLVLDAEVSLLQLVDIQHLITRFKGSLKPQYDLGDVLSLLHPTPAVCGEPKVVAAQLIDRLESHSRAWYSGVVGAVSADSSEFSVAIRSAHIKDKNVHIYSGAGIVAGSDPKEEWAELDQKIRLFLECYDGIQIDS